MQNKYKIYLLPTSHSTVERKIFTLSLAYFAGSGGGGRGTQGSCIRIGSAPEVQPLILFIQQFLQKKVTLSYTFYWQILPLSNTKA